MSMATVVPRSGAFSKAYSLAYAWDKNARLTDQQHVAISALSHALSGRPFPANLLYQQDGDKESAFEEAVGAMDAVLVNTHQFYKWLAELESSMKSEIDEKYRLYESLLQEHVTHVTVSFNKWMTHWTYLKKCNHCTRVLPSRHKLCMMQACGQLLVEKQKLIGFIR